METTLVVMAAGIGSRFGGGVKQLAPVGPNGEIIMDYSIADAFEAGFDRVIFIIRKAIEQDFMEVIGNRLKERFPGRIAYAYQELTDLPIGFLPPKDRTKPFGTGHAVLSCRGILETPALVINADDYYGKDAYRRMHETLLALPIESEQSELCMPGFILGNTLSENGGVTRGLCRVNDEGYLTEIVETTNICVGDERFAYVKENGIESSVPLDTPVSMNMWGITPAFLDVLESEFRTFLSSLDADDLKSEFLLPRIVGKLLSENRARVRVVTVHDRWFGVTYKEDRAFVADSIRALVDAGVYPSPLF